MCACVRTVRCFLYSILSQHVKRTKRCFRVEPANKVCDATSQRTCHIVDHFKHLLIQQDEGPVGGPTFEFNLFSGVHRSLWRSCTSPRPQAIASTCSSTDPPSFLLASSSAFRLRFSELIACFCSLFLQFFHPLLGFILLFCLQQSIFRFITLFTFSSVSSRTSLMTSVGSSTLSPTEVASRISTVLLSFSASSAQVGARPCRHQFVSSRNGCVGSIRAAASAAARDYLCVFFHGNHGFDQIRQPSARMTLALDGAPRASCSHAKTPNGFEDPLSINTNIPDREVSHTPPSQQEWQDSVARNSTRNSQTSLSENG